jgi:hypothetical protein
VGGNAGVTHRTRAKMLIDDEFFYVAAFCEDNHVWATLTERNSVIFHDCDFEVFLDCDGDARNYYEYEVNALGTTWQLSLDKPYSLGGTAQSPHELPGLVSAVHVDGKINDPSSEDRGWGVTVAFPLGPAGLGQFGAGPIVRGETSWRVNFSRVHWDHRVVDKGTRYERVPPHGTPMPQGPNEFHPEKNWVWSPQRVVNMHVPESWGWVDMV